MILIFSFCRIGLSRLILSTSFYSLLSKSICVWRPRTHAFIIFTTTSCFSTYLPRIDSVGNSCFGSFISPTFLSSYALKMGSSKIFLNFSIFSFCMSCCSDSTIYSGSFIFCKCFEDDYFLPLKSELKCITNYPFLECFRFSGAKSSILLMNEEPLLICYCGNGDKLMLEGMVLFSPSDSLDANGFMSRLDFLAKSTCNAGNRVGDFFCVVLCWRNILFLPLISLSVFTSSS